MCVRNRQKILERTKIVTSFKNRRTKNQTNSIFKEPKMKFKLKKKKKLRRKQVSFWNNRHLNENEKVSQVWEEPNWPNKLSPMAIKTS